MPFKNQHPLYSVWRGMRDRCFNPKSKQFADYGGRGISTCERWSDFHLFVLDMGPRPEGYSIDRIDNDGNYCPENCRWADRRTQQRNRRSAVFVTVDGIKYRAIELAEAAGVKTDTILDRVARGLPIQLVTAAGNLRNTSGLSLGGAANGHRQQARTHCKMGHEFTEANTNISPQGWRRCRACHNAKMRRRYQAKRST